MVNNTNKSKINALASQLPDRVYLRSTFEWLARVDIFRSADNG